MCPFSPIPTTFEPHRKKRFMRPSRALIRLCTCSLVSLRRPVEGSEDPKLQHLCPTEKNKQKNIYMYVTYANIEGSERAAHVHLDQFTSSG